MSSDASLQAVPDDGLSADHSDLRKQQMEQSIRLNAERKKLEDSRRMKIEAEKEHQRERGEASIRLAAEAKALQKERQKNYAAGEKLKKAEMAAYKAKQDAEQKWYDDQRSATKAKQEERKAYMKELNEMSSRQIAVNTRRVRAEAAFEQGMRRADIDRRTARDQASLLERTTKDNTERDLRDHLYLLETDHRQKLFDVENKYRSQLQNLKLEIDQLKRTAHDPRLLVQQTSSLQAKRHHIDADAAEARRTIEEAYQRSKRRLEDDARQAILRAQNQCRETFSTAERTYAHRVEELKADLTRAKRG